MGECIEVFATKHFHENTALVSQILSGDGCDLPVQLDRAPLIDVFDAAGIGCAIGENEIHLLPVHCSDSFLHSYIIEYIHNARRDIRCDPNDWLEIKPQHTTMRPQSVRCVLEPAARCGADIEDTDPRAQEVVPLVDIHQLVHGAGAIPFPGGTPTPLVVGDVGRRHSEVVPRGWHLAEDC